MTKNDWLTVLQIIYYALGAFKFWKELENYKKIIRN